jgi:hypothetical protein
MAYSSNTSQDTNCTKYNTASKADLLKEIERLQGQVAAAEKRAKSAETKAKYFEEKCAELASELHFQSGIISNKTFQGNVKSVMIGVKKAVEEARRKGAPEKDGLIRVYREDIARHGGCSVDTVSSNLKKLDTSGLVLKKEVPGEGKSGNFIKEIYLDIPKAVVENPGKVEVAEELQLGGKKVPLCKDCHSEHIERKVSYICHDCGSVMNEDEPLLVSEEILQREREMALEAAAEQPAIPVPERDCMPCTDALDAPYRNWIWDRQEQRWRCGNEAMHTLYKKKE